jgi:hypothetical protein
VGYTVRDAYQILTSQDSVILGEAEDLIWHRQVPLKVSILAWRFLRDRLPTKANLLAARLTCLCLGGLERKKYPGLQKLRKYCATALGQSQAFFLSVAADDGCYFGY